MKNFEQLTTTELTTINGGAGLDFLGTLLGSLGIGGALGSVGSNTGGVTTGSGNALTLVGAGVGSLINNIGNSLFAVSGGVAHVLNGIALPV